MHKKKKTLYIMLPIVLLVWGGVFYQIYTYFVYPPVYATQTIEKVVNIDEIKIDTFSIVANYRDPFLGKTAKKINTSNNYPGAIKKSITSQQKRKNITVAKIEKKWPLITFNGMIKNNSSNSKVAIITIEGKEHLVKEGLQIDEVRILKIEKKAVQVRFQKEKKTIVK